MFSNVRWRIALWFVGLSTLTYVVPTILALFMFYASLTSAIDGELNGFIASFGHAIKIEDGQPRLRDWARAVQTIPAHSLVTYQLFDRNEHLLEEHFPAGIPKLFRHEHEVRADNGLSMRTLMTPLFEDKQVIGYLQVQLPTKSRDDALKQLALIMAVIAPVVLLGLGWSSYLVSEKATVQTRKTLATLRQFIADAGHELYTPLSIVQAANETLAKLVAPTGLGIAEFEASESALDRMEKMLEDLMLLSTMESPEQRESNQIMNLAPLLEEIVNEFRPKFARKGVALSEKLEVSALVRGDRMALQRLLSNIIENAWRYTDAHGTVTVAMSKDAHHCQISVSDTGIGIPKDDLPRVFDRFYRVDASRSRASGGSGLGLAIALAITETHGGTLTAESELGRGTTFTLNLPASSDS